MLQHKTQLQENAQKRQQQENKIQKFLKTSLNTVTMHLKYGTVRCR